LAGPWARRLGSGLHASCPELRGELENAVEKKTRDFLVGIAVGLIPMIFGGPMLYELYVRDPEMLRTISVSLTGSLEPSPIAVGVSWLLSIGLTGLSLFMVGAAVVQLVKTSRK
jgi:hypothetical protein